MAYITQEHMTIHLNPELAHLRVHEREVDRVLAGNIGKHTVNGFGVLDLDPEAHPFQRMDCVKVTSDGASADELLGLSAFVYPKIDRLVDYLMDERKELLDEIVKHYENYRELNLLTNHLFIDAIAVAGASMLIGLEKSGRINAKEINTELFVSSMMKRTTLYGRATVALITQAFPMLRFSIPSNNEKNREIPSYIRGPFNDASEADIDEEPIDKPTLRLVAGSATSDRKSGRTFGKRNKQNPTIHMGPMSDGTKTLAERSKMIGYGLDTKSEEPEFYVSDLIDPSTQELGAQTVMVDIARGLSLRSSYPRQYHFTRESFEFAAPRGKQTKNTLTD